MVTAHVNILLIGLRGSGKSTLGPRLAERIGFSFTDLDDLVARAMGEDSPGKAFAKHGQAAFRQMEGKMLIDVVRPLGQVIALGGGTPTGMVALESIRREKSQGRARVLYLRGQPATLQARLAATDLSSRPSLTGASPLAEIDEVFAKRDPLYLGLADHVIQIDELTPEACLDQMTASLRADQSG